MNGWVDTFIDRLVQLDSPNTNNAEGRHIRMDMAPFAFTSIMNTPESFDDQPFKGFGSHLFVTDDRFDSECGIIRFDPATLRTRVADRPYDPFERFLPRLEAVASEEGEEALRELSIRLIRGTMMPELREDLPYDAVEALVEAAEDALEPGHTSYNFDRLLDKHRDDIVSAGLFEWMLCGTEKYGAPPLLAAANLLDEDGWAALQTAYELAEWLDDNISDGEREHLYAPDQASRIVEKFLSEFGYGYQQCRG